MNGSTPSLRYELENACCLVTSHFESLIPLLLLRIWLHLRLVMGPRRLLRRFWGFHQPSGEFLLLYGDLQPFLCLLGDAISSAFEYPRQIIVSRC
jgi:hypothetical protein